MATRGRGRPPLANKSHQTFVRIPYEVYKVTKEKAQRDNITVSALILNALKYFLGVK